MRIFGLRLFLRSLGDRRRWRDRRFLGDRGRSTGAHVHFEVYPSLASASTSKNALATSQLAFPEDICKLVYATDGYSASVRNLSQISLKTDNVFSDGWTLQMATLTGDVNSGYTATLVVGV